MGSEVFERKFWRSRRSGHLVFAVGLSFNDEVVTTCEIGSASAIDKQAFLEWFEHVPECTSFDWKPVTSEEVECVLFRCIQFIEGHESTHGRTFGCGVDARELLEKLKSNRENKAQ